VIPASVGYLRPDTIEDAIGALGDPEAKLLAGCHSLVPMMKLRLARPTLLVDIGRLDLRGMHSTDAGLQIGTLTTYAELIESQSVEVPEALREAAAAVGDLQVRNRGTVGGGIAHADPASDVAAAVIALGARLRLRSADGVRVCAGDSFFQGPFTTTLGQEEILEAILVARPADGAGSAYRSVQDAASGYARAGAAVRVVCEGGRVTACTVGLTGAGAAPGRMLATETALLADEGRPVGETVRGTLADLRLAGGREDRYLRQLVAVTVVRAFEAARARALEQEAT
jgi:aerobic carbon-monoxide dehydrogenase medium subunit